MKATRFLAALALASAAEAATVPVVNGGFEDISMAQQSFNEFTFGSLTGWTPYDPNGVAGSGTGGTYYVGTLTPQIIPERDPVNYQNFPAGAPEGQRVAIAFNFENSSTPGNEYGLQQQLSATLQPNTEYSLSVLIGNIASGWSVSGQFFDLTGFPGYRVDLMAGGTVLASDNNSLAGTIPDGQFGQSTVTFSTGALPPNLGEQLRIRLVNLNVVDPSSEFSDREVDFDNVQLTAVAIPEPAGTSLLVAGFAALMAAVCRRRAQTL